MLTLRHKVHILRWYFSIIASLADLATIRSYSPKGAGGLYGLATPVEGRSYSVLFVLTNELKLPERHQLSKEAVNGMSGHFPVTLPPLSRWAGTTVSRGAMPRTRDTLGSRVGTIVTGDVNVPIPV